VTTDARKNHALLIGALRDVIRMTLRARIDVRDVQVRAVFRMSRRVTSLARVVAGLVAQRQMRTVIELRLR